MLDLSQRSVQLGATALGGAALGSLWCLFRRKSASQRVRDIQFQREEFSTREHTEEPGEPGMPGFSLHVPLTWEVHHEDSGQTKDGEKVYRVSHPTEHDRQILLIIEKVDGETTINEYIKIARDHTISELKGQSELSGPGMMQTVDILPVKGDEIEIQEPRLKVGQFVLKCDPLEETMDGRLDGAEIMPIMMWSGGCIHAGYAWIFQFCATKQEDFEDTMEKSRKIIGSLRFLAGEA